MRSVPGDPRLVAAVVGRYAVPRILLKAAGAPRRRVPRTPPTGKEVEAERPFWGKHPDPQIAQIEEAFYRPGFTFLATLAGAVLGKTPPRSLQKAGFAHEGGHIEGWGKVAELFNSDKSPEVLMDGWTKVIDKLVKSLLPQNTILQKAQAMAIQSHLMWKAGMRVSGQLPDPSLGWLKAKAEVPETAAKSMEWTKLRAVEHMTDLTGEARHNLLTCLVASKESGEGQGKLQQRLFDGFSVLNRDWRRVALTESALASCNGALASVDPAEGWEAQWIAGAKACKWCQAWNGKRYKVVSPDADKKDGDTQVWPGKHNVGRSAHAWSQKEERFRTKDEMWWPTIPAHPNCACDWAMRRVK